jgi:hypothetical protein
MDKKPYVIILEDGRNAYAVPVGDGHSTKDEAMERVEFWNSVEGFTATLAIAEPLRG